MGGTAAVVGAAAVGVGAAARALAEHTELSLLQPPEFTSGVRKGRRPMTCTSTSEGWRRTLYDMVSAAFWVVSAFVAVSYMDRLANLNPFVSGHRLHRRARQHTVDLGL